MSVARRRAPDPARNRVARRVGAQHRELEHNHQSLLIQWAFYQRMRYFLQPRPDGTFLSVMDLLFAVPNGGGRSKAQAGKLRAEGVRPGIPDLCLAFPVGLFHGLYIEMKAPRADGGQAPDKHQRTVHDDLRTVGYRVEVCFGYDEATAAIASYLAPRFPR